MAYGRTEAQTHTKNQSKIRLLRPIKSKGYEQNRVSNPLSKAVMSSGPRHAANLDRPDSNEFQNPSETVCHETIKRSSHRKSLKSQSEPRRNGCRQLRQFADPLNVKYCLRGSN